MHTNRSRTYVLLNALHLDALHLLAPLLTRHLLLLLRAHLGAFVLLGRELLVLLDAPARAPDGFTLLFRKL